MARLSTLFCLVMTALWVGNAIIDDRPYPPQSVGVHYGDYFANTKWPATNATAAIDFIHQNVGHLIHMRTWKDPVQCKSGWSDCVFQGTTLAAIKFWWANDSLGERVNTMMTITAPTVKALAAVKRTIDSGGNSTTMDEYIGILQTLIDKYNIFDNAYLTDLAVSSEPDLDKSLTPDDVLQAVTLLKAKLRPAIDEQHHVNMTLSFTVPFSYGVMGSSSPPSVGQFNSNWSQTMPDLLKVIDFFSINIYPHASCASLDNSKLSYCLGRGNATDNMGYPSMFEAQLDAVRAALYKVNNTIGETIPISVTETGWPTAGSAALASQQNACFYTNNLLRWIKSGTGTPGLWRPSNPTSVIPDKVYFFEAFNEDGKSTDPNDSERYLGVYQATGDNTGAKCAYGGGIDWEKGKKCIDLPTLGSFTSFKHDLNIKGAVSPATPQPNSVVELKITVTAQRPQATSTAELEAATPEATPEAADAVTAAAPEADAADGAVVEESSPLASVLCADGLTAAPQNAVPACTPAGAKNVKVTCSLSSLSTFVSVSTNNNGQGSRSEGHMLAPANSGSGSSCNYKQSTHQVECLFPTLAYRSSKVITIKLKPKAGYHEHVVMATSSHAGFTSGGPLVALLSHRACYPKGSSAGCAGATRDTSTNTCCSNTCTSKLVSHHLQWSCA